MHACSKRWNSINAINPLTYFHTSPVLQFTMLWRVDVQLGVARYVASAFASRSRQTAEFTVASIHGKQHVILALFAPEAPRANKGRQGGLRAGTNEKSEGGGDSVILSFTHATREILPRCRCRCRYRRHPRYASVIAPVVSRHVNFALLTPFAISHVPTHTLTRVMQTCGRLGTGLNEMRRTKSDVTARAVHD